MVRLAAQHDAEALYALRRAVEAWLAERGIEQWGEGAVAVSDIRSQIEREEWFVAADGDAILAGVRYLDRDEDVWPDAVSGEARYIHGLMVDRGRAWPGVGARLLACAESRAVEEGIRWMRLDCVETNDRLRGFYASNGYREVGRKDFDGPWFSVTLFEKALH